MDGLNYGIALKFDKHVGSSAAEVPVKYQSHRTILYKNPPATSSYDKASYQILKRAQITSKLTHHHAFLSKSFQYELCMYLTVMF